MCPPCFEELLESLAVALDATYDREAMNEWERCGSVLSRFYGPWFVLEKNGWWVDRFEIERLSRKD